MTAVGPGAVGPGTYIRPPLTQPEKYERMAFTFCRMGTVGLIAWVVTPAIFVLVVAIVAIALYAKSITLGVEANYLNRWSLDLSYTNYFGAGQFNLISDRDFVAFVAKYSF